jgi:hypothetical protein
LPIAVTGPEGDGKSALAAGAAKACSPGFDFEISELYSPTEQEMEQKMRMLPKYEAIVADEAINILYKLNWQNKMQKYLNQLFALCRQENKIAFLCMPRFTDFNEYFRNHRIRIWLHIIDPISNEKPKGHAVVFAKSWSPVSIDPWYLKEMQKIIDAYGKKKCLKEVEFSLEDKIACLSKMRTYVGVLEFGWLPQTDWETYLRLKNENKYKGLHLAAEDESKSKLAERYLRHRRLYMRRLREKGDTLQQIGEVVGLAPQNVLMELSKLDTINSFNPQNKP